jgi:hypothetical protein
MDRLRSKFGDFLFGYACPPDVLRWLAAGEHHCDNWAWLTRVKDQSGATK